MKISKLLKISVIASLISGSAYADVVDDSFFPYKNATPKYSGLSVGMTIDQSNVDRFSDILDPGIAQQIKDGWTSF